MNHSEFVRRLRERDPAAVQHLTQCFLPSVWRFVYVRVDRDRHLAEDLVGEAVLELVRAAATDAQIQNPAAWLRAVAHHKVQDHYRAVARVQQLLDQARQEQGVLETSDPSKQHELLERRMQIRQVMDELPERHRLALEWKYIEKQSVREIARRLEASEKAVESMLFRARREFRDKLLRKEKHEAQSDGSHAEDEEHRSEGNATRCSDQNGAPNRDHSAVAEEIEKAAENR